eukprot:9790279-Alexandrium_andersonii.AAC.1
MGTGAALALALHVVRMLALAAASARASWFQEPHFLHAPSARGCHLCQAWLLVLRGSTDEGHSLLTDTKSRLIS